MTFPFLEQIYKILNFFGKIQSFCGNFCFIFVENHPFLEKSQKHVVTLTETRVFDFFPKIEDDFRQKRSFLTKKITYFQKKNGLFGKVIGFF